MTSGKAFTFDGVSHTYRTGTQSLSDFSSSAQKGERISLIGPSGCGKSTALRLLAGLEEPTNGSVHVDHSNDVGFVFQEPTLLPWASVFENVFMPLRVKGASKAAQTPDIEAAIERVGLSDFRNAYPRELSGGMQMRVSIARAMVTRPALLLMDEPFGALDEMTRFDLNDLVLELQARDGFTLAFVTHSVFEAVYISDRVVVMSNRPGTVLHDISTPSAKTPGGFLMGDAYRASEIFSKQCAEVSAALRSM